MGASIPAHGLEKPNLVITFMASPNDKTLHKLTIGSQTADQMWYAKVDERAGTFVLSNPDLSALKLPLSKSAATSPSPSPSATAPNSH
jgi:hypothetical protein